MAAVTGQNKTEIVGRILSSVPRMRMALHTPRHKNKAIRLTGPKDCTQVKKAQLRDSGPQSDKKEQQCSRTGREIGKDGTF